MNNEDQLWRLRGRSTLVRLLGWGCSWPHDLFFRQGCLRKDGIQRPAERWTEKGRQVLFLLPKILVPGTQRVRECEHSSQPRIPGNTLFLLKLVSDLTRQQIPTCALGGSDCGHQTLSH